ncbi:cysteine hydrolase family protein [Paracoccus denitrificans]|jgi:nicotinamidase-related amidase|uniref:Isochorismatase hydrolase n=1 Tax=Paracoccus denitrificans (strain Pd 1222) TaxID=318586 RepID=A1B2J0_PARDP|nr:isochorismatase family cysteine hydrolase [Paracoccus denitrificans]ABL69734.1 isochorismatase hydrolase [Paracoccus denitrificans PD1222]MBB4630072.1 nicotinamidase-related amidase [Paracoccus denitrificans]MCU7431397.1 cysteine hydrolase [Paracoccus denitrificans]QAR25139.1 cysteine hydrolase [Paracoccus denitrificans]UPV94013.1 cysteine hydrolase [Paracoccus denitrificans]
MQETLRFGPLPPETLHLCIDMQKLFAAGSPWAVPWIERILPGVAALVAARPERTLFTRFIPPARLKAAPGAWARYYAEWPEMLRERLDSQWLELLPELARHVPPARVVDKPVYSPWHDGRLNHFLRGAGISTLVVTGGETDVCVLATVMGAVDLGYRVVLVSDAICSSTDMGHDAAMTLYRTRFSQQIETAPLAELLDAWPAG